MAWLKGVRTDGFIKIDENVNFRGTIIGAGDGIMRPYGALDYYVDGTDGSDSYSGKSWEGAFKTIQKALTTQIANASGKGDNIWVAPGTYAESLTGNMTKVQIIGTTCGGMTNAVSIRPTISNAYVGEMVESAFRNIEFREPTSDNQAYAAVAVKMDYSIIDNCTFLGTTDYSGTVGLRIGGEGTPGEWEHMFNSRVSNCKVSTTGNRTYQPDYGIVFGGIDVTTNSATRQFIDSEIVNNRIFAQSAGIKLNTAASNCSGGLIIGNYLNSHQGSAGVATGIVENSGTTNNLCGVVNNRIVCSVSGIVDFGQWNLQGNIVSVAGETGVSTHGYEA